MPNLKDLKVRLEKLPALRDERELSDHFKKYSEKISQVRAKLKISYIEMQCIEEVFPNMDPKNKIAPLFKKSTRLASKLHNSIAADPKVVTKKSTDTQITNLDDYAKSAHAQCHDYWATKISASVMKWEKVAAVIADLGAEGGADFQNTVSLFKSSSVPQCKEDIANIKEYQNKLQVGIANLGLEGSFGKFLEASASGGAPAKDLLKEEIKEKIDEFDLWDSFAVRIGR